MMRRILVIAAVVAAAGSVLLAPPAGAQAYGGCDAQVSDDTPSPGQTITVTGSGADASATVTASLDGQVIGSGTATAIGNFSFDATIPGTASGSEALTVDCGSTGTEVLDLTVTAPATTTTAVSGTGLPRTGSSSTIPMTRVGVASLLVGGLVLAAAIRRRHQVTQPDSH